LNRACRTQVREERYMEMFSRKKAVKRVASPVAVANNQPAPPPAIPTVVTTVAVEAAAPLPPPLPVGPPPADVVPDAPPDAPLWPPDTDLKIDKKVCLNDLFITLDEEAKACKGQILATIPSDIRDVVPLIMSYLQFRFEKGTSLDVLDTVSKWYESEIKDIKEDKLFIHYKGWPETWDEWIEKRAYARFAPINHYSTRGFVSRNAQQEPQIDETEKNRRIALLVSIGFQMDVVTAALRRFSWNIEQAASSLLT